MLISLKALLALWQSLYFCSRIYWDLVNLALWLALVLRWNRFVLRVFLHCSGFAWFHLLWGNCLICVCDIVWSRIQRHGSYWENGWKSWVHINLYTHWIVHEPKYLKHYDLFDIFLIWNLYILLSCRFSAFSSTFNTFFTSFMTVSEKTQIKIKLNIMFSYILHKA